MQGYYDRGKGEVVLFEGADAGTLAHEIGWHAVWHWAERNSPDLLLKMKRYAARTPQKLKALIKEVYGDFKGEALMDEIGAGRFERAMGERFQKLLTKSPEVRGWWRKVLHALARAWKGMARTVGGNRIDLKKIEKMDPEEAIEALTAQMLEGRRLGEGGGAGKGIRPSIGGIYTGTAADYANRSRQGGKDDGPSVKKIGTGEGSQVYGWGLYGSTERGVAEGYAGKGLDRRGERVWTKGGKSPNELTRVESDAAKVIRGSGSREQAIRVIEEGIEDFRKDGLKKLEEHYQAIKKEISEHGDEYAPAHANLYEQTFFTDREPGDESHLLKWYEDLPKEQVDWIAQEFAKEGFFVASFSKLKGWTILDRTSGKKMSLWDKRESGEAYEAIAKFLGSPQAASEFLARAGIDGVKYPVDSYGGKGVKDGDKAGWNYVAFSDEHIRVDHKWTDGEMRYARRKRVGKISQRVPRSERRAFHSEYNKAIADYAHNNNGETPKACGVFTSEAYYVFDIINGEPLNIHRIKVDGRNREKIKELDKKYKSEIYKGTRDSAYWFDRIGNELSEHLQAGNGNQDRETGARSGNLDLRANESAQRGVSEPRGDNAPGEREPVVAGRGAQKDSQQFKRWFADSKVVDENGEPLVVYRGSPYDPLAQETGKGVIKPEAYFTADPEYAKRYTGNGGKVGAYYLNIRRPFDIRDPECLKDLQSIYPDHEFIKGKSGALDWGEASIVDGEFLRENFGDKYDGIVYDEGGDPTGSGVKYRGVSYVPLDGGAQVKSATDNIGTFDPGNPDIRYARGGKRRDEVYDDVLRAVRAGGQRVAAGRS